MGISQKGLLSEEGHGWDSTQTIPVKGEHTAFHNGLPLMKHTEQWDIKLSDIYPLVIGKDFCKHSH